MKIKVYQWKCVFVVIISYLVVVLILFILIKHF